MYRVSKILNNNGVIAINTEDNQEYVLLGKGIGFGKKVSQRFEVTEDTATYRLTEQTDRGSAKSLVQEMDPEFLEIADEVIREAEKVFGKVDRRIMIPLADHISFAVSRIRNQEQISNPLTDDIRVLFHNEFQVASVLRDILQKRMQITIDEHEIGYVALHIHSAEKRVMPLLPCILIFGNIKIIFSDSQESSEPSRSSLSFSSDSALHPEDYDKFFAQ